jgi:hypothetical protein
MGLAWHFVSDSPKLGTFNGYAEPVAAEAMGVFHRLARRCEFSEQWAAIVSRASVPRGSFATGCFVDGMANPSTCSPHATGAIL